MWITTVHVYRHLFYFIYLVKLSPLFDATSYGEIKIINISQLPCASVSEATASALASVLTTSALVTTLSFCHTLFVYSNISHCAQMYPVFDAIVLYLATDRQT